MAKSIKLKNNNYWDTKGIVHNEQSLSDLLTTMNARSLCTLYKTAIQTISAAASTQVKVTLEGNSKIGNNITISNSRATFNSNVKNILINAKVTFSLSSGGYTDTIGVRIRLYSSAGTLKNEITAYSIVANNGNYQNISITDCLLLNIASGDYIELYTHHGGSNNHNIIGSSTYHTYITVAEI